MVIDVVKNPRRDDNLSLLIIEGRDLVGLVSIGSRVEDGSRV